MITTTIQSLLASMGIEIEQQFLSFLIRKGAHFTEFFILGLFIKQSSNDTQNKLFLYLGFLVPILDETLQSFIPGRAMAVTDMMIDWVGILFGVFVLIGFHRINKNHQNLEK
jgi:VanZ family protein